VSVISNLLIPIVKLWLRSQAKQVGEINIAVGGSSWQVMQGKIPYAKVQIADVIYQDIHITNAQLDAQAINLNVPELIQGKPLKLHQPIQVNIDAFLDRPAVANSLQSKLFKDAIHQLTTNYTSPTSDLELGYYLQLLIDSLGDQFHLQELTVKNGTILCKAIFPIHAT
jgi:hypothetical protein